MFDVDNALCTLVQLGGSDLHLKIQAPPLTRVDGELRPIEGAAPLTPEDTETAVRTMLADPVKLDELAREHEVDFSYSITGIARFRVNAFRQRGSLSLVCRAIPHSIRTVADLNLPPVISELAEEERGIILLTGTTGSGKSTTLAAMIDHINSRTAKHIVTIEDPIEFLHVDKKSVINQREVGQDTLSFKRALRRVLRQDPDVILIGEMRDEETVHTALSAAETGHLVLSTVHTVDAAETVNRIIDFFPPHMEGQIRAMLAGTLKRRRLPAPRALDRRRPRRHLRDHADDRPRARHDHGPGPDRPPHGGRLRGCLLRHADLRSGAVRARQGRPRRRRPGHARGDEPARLQAAARRRRQARHDDGGRHLSGGAARCRINRRSCHTSVCKVLGMDDTCPVCKTAEIVCGKWTLLLIRDLSEGRSRFCELERSLAGISPRTLSLRLRALEEEGIVERDTFPEVPPRVEYQLTEKGRALVPLIDGMREYGTRWLGAHCAELGPGEIPSAGTGELASAGAPVDAAVA